MSSLNGSSSPKGNLRKSSTTSTSSGVTMISKTRLDESKKRAYRKNKLFRKIEADIKERDRKRIPGRMETYVDRDRMIAVSIGASDIRSSILKQKGYLMRHSIFASEDGSGFRTLLEQATHEIHKGSYDIALQYLNKALAMNPNHRDCLILRGICLVGLQESSSALDDANAVLQTEAGHTARTFLVKGNALYQLGEFEHALVHFYRALQRCASSAMEDDILKGIRRSEEAIDNSLGSKSTGHFQAMPSVLNSIPSTIFGMPWHELKLLKWKEDDEKVREKPKLSNASNSTSSAYDTSTRKLKSPNDGIRTRARKKRDPLLGKLSVDLEYLEGLLTDVQITSDVSTPERFSMIEGSSKDISLKRAAEDAISFLKNRQEFWSQFKPSYCQQKI